MKTEQSLRVTGNSKGISALFTPGRYSFQRARQKVAVSLAFWRVLLAKETVEFQSSDCFQFCLETVFPTRPQLIHFFSFFWDQVHSFSFHEHVAERTVHRNSVSSLSHYGLTRPLKKQAHKLWYLQNTCHPHPWMNITCIYWRVLSEKPF